MFVSVICRLKWLWGLGGKILRGKNRSTQRTPVPVPLFPRQISHKLARDWNLASAVRGRQLPPEPILGEKISNCSLSIAPRFPKEHWFWKVPRLHLFVFLVRATCRQSWLWSIVGITLTGEKRSTCRKTCSSASLSTTNLTLTGLG